MPDQTQDLAERMRVAVEDSIIAALRKGDWLYMSHDSRINFDRALVRQVYERIDKARVVEAVTERAQQHMADVIYNSLATEIATDVKQILSNKELREDVRSMIRERIRAATKEVTSE